MFPAGSPALTTAQVGTAAARPSAGSVAKGYLYYASDTNALSESDGASTWTTIVSGNPTSGLAAVNFQWAYGAQTGDFTTTSSTFGDLTGTNAWNIKGGTTNNNGQVSIAAVTGDMLELTLVAGATVSAANAMLLDFSVAGSLLGTTRSYRDPTNTIEATARAIVVVTAGMISGGVVACKPQFANLDNSSTQTIRNESTNKRAPSFTVVNWLH